MAVLIEIISFLVAQVACLFLMFVLLPDIAGAMLAYVLGIAFGGLGSRLSAMWRERLSERPSRIV